MFTSVTNQQYLQKLQKNLKLQNYNKSNHCKNKSEILIIPLADYEHNCVCGINTKSTNIKQQCDCCHCHTHTNCHSWLLVPHMGY